jgi:hypothetical protein
MASIVYSNRVLTDGRIDRSALGLVAAMAGIDLELVEACVETLLETRLYDLTSPEGEASDGWWVHDYLDYQLSREEILARQAGSSRTEAKREEVETQRPAGDGQEPKRKGRASRAKPGAMSRAEAARRAAQVRWGRRQRSGEEEPPWSPSFPGGSVAVPESQEILAEKEPGWSQGLRGDDATGQMPQGIEVMRRATKSMPHGIENMPQGIDTMRRGTESMPHGIDRMPHGIENMPQGIETMRRGTKSMPHGIDRMPHGIENMPQGNASGMPHGIENAMGRMPQRISPLHPPLIPDPSPDRILNPIPEPDPEQQQQGALLLPGGVAEMPASVGQQAEADEVEELARACQVAEMAGISSDTAMAREEAARLWALCDREAGFWEAAVRQCAKYGSRKLAYLSSVIETNVAAGTWPGQRRTLRPTPGVMAGSGSGERKMRAEPADPGFARAYEQVRQAGIGTGSETERMFIHSLWKECAGPDQAVFFAAAVEDCVAHGGKSYAYLEKVVQSNLARDTWPGWKGRARAGAAAEWWTPDGIAAHWGVPAVEPELAAEAVIA